ncbi:uncharacterized protein LOC126672819 [Mercurialis annua]|uniref:uncharacterized protein LOC126672819 n=1 Tax=Mercurialis annua TaxID=3986 RepID=UPI00215EF2F9|nr:uncharacterized protein LOC126672819 [Mercurialis annua]
MANAGFSQPVGLTILDDVIHKVFGCLTDDIIGVSLPRMNRRLVFWPYPFLLFPHKKEEIGCWNGAASSFSDLLLNQEMDAHAAFDMVLRQKEIYLKDKSRISWLKEGDRNSEFFHRSCNIRKTKAGIHSMLVDGVLTDDTEKIGNHITTYYDNLFKAAPLSYPNLDIVKTIIPNMVTEEENVELVKCPSNEDIKAIVFDMDGSSAPGPDGFSGAFYKNCWDIVGKDLCNLVIHFFKFGKLSSGLCSSIMVLIPKIKEAIMIEQFRPIVLSNFCFKVITKIVANRLANIAERILSENQFGFVKNRSISHCIAAASEGINVLNKSCFGGNMAMKIDIKKAFDTMEWGFILEVLDAFGFSLHFRDWILEIFSSARISIMINGTTKGYFSCSRGVRQGDPLSPLLFCIAEDFLSRLISYYVQIGDLKLMSYSRAIKAIFEMYGSISGQWVSWDKSSAFFGKSVTDHRARNLTSLLNIKQGNLPFDYLDIPLFIGAPRKCYLQKIADRITSKFSGWKGSALSMAGRVTLVNSLVSVPWKICCRANKDGGLGLKNLHAMNKAMLSKIAWDMISYDVFPLNVLKTRFLTVSSVPKQHPIGSSVWSSIKESKKTDLAKDFFDGSWHLPNEIPLDIANEISLIIPCNDTSDTCLWVHSLEGNFKVNLNYSMIIGARNPVPWSKFIWKAYLPPSRSMTCWRAFLGYLPTDCSLQKKGFNMASRCNFCNAAVEDIEHIFVRCPFAQNLWNTVGLIFGRRINTDDSLKNLILEASNENFSHQVFDIWNVAVVTSVGLSCALKECDSFSHRPSNNSISELQILSNLRIRNVSPKPLKVTSIFWRPPPSGWIKVNTDSSALGTPGPAGGGGIFRNARGFCKGCFSVNLGSAFAFWAEIETAIFAVLKEKDMGFDHLWLECYSIYVVNLFKRRDWQIPWKLRLKWIACLNYISNIRFVVSHIYREGNIVADTLARHGVSIQGMMWWYQAPDFCSISMYDDLAGKERVVSSKELGCVSRAIVFNVKLTIPLVVAIYCGKWISSELSPRRFFLIPEFSGYVIP